MIEKKLTAAQVHLLEPLERNFKQATEAAWCSYPGQAAIANMLQVWTDLTGQAYPYKPGCPNCLVNLVRDMGTIYFAQKDEALAAEAAKKGRWNCPGCKQSTKGKQDYQSKEKRRKTEIKTHKKEPA